jgi:hypothetical protein
MILHARGGRVCAALFALAVISAGCSGMTISTDFDPSKTEEMKAYGTYAWLTGPAGDSRTAGAFIDKRVKYVADQVFAEKGFALTEKTGADFLVGWHASLDRKLSYNTVNTYYGYGWGYWGGYGTSRSYVTEYKEGTLLLDIVDAATNELVWRGIAQAEVYPQADADYRNRQIESAVRKMLSQFPPQS